MRKDTITSLSSETENLVIVSDAPTRTHKPTHGILHNVRVRCSV